jgi:hypothetical protein
VGVFADPDRHELVVAESLDWTVSAYTCLGVLKTSWRMPHEPRWLARHPTRDAIYVAIAQGDAIRVIIDGDHLGQVDFPILTQGKVILAGRATGDLAVSPWTRAPTWRW